MHIVFLRNNTRDFNKYSPLYLFSQIICNYAYRNSDIRNVCGKQNIDINKSNFLKIIEFGKNDRYYFAKRQICCNYEFKNMLDNNYDIYLSVLKNSSKIFEKNYFCFFIYIFNYQIQLF